jgi:hypothetical protein
VQTELGALKADAVSCWAGHKGRHSATTTSQRDAGKVAAREVGNRLGDVVHAETQVMDAFSVLLEMLGNWRFGVDRFEQLNEGISTVQVGHARAGIGVDLARGDIESELIAEVAKGVVCRVDSNSDVI